MKRLIEKTVFFAFVTACRLAAWPTRRSPLLAKATIEGVVRAPSEFSITTGSPPSMTAMQELVVPRSIPRILAIGNGVRSERQLCQKRAFVVTCLLSISYQDGASTNRARISAIMAHCDRSGPHLGAPRLRLAHHPSLILRRDMATLFFTSITHERSSSYRPTTRYSGYDRE